MGGIRKDLKYIKRILLLLFLFLYFPAYSKASNYDNQAKPHYDKEGNITWRATDKRATPKVTSWSTIGFTLRANTCKVTSSGIPHENDGNPRKDNKYGTLVLQNEWIKSNVINSTTSVTTFTIPEHVITKAVQKAKINSMTLQLSGGNIYLNGIFQINYRNGKSEKILRTRKGIYKLSDIMFPSDVSWSRPQDFRDRFDVPVPYEPKPQPVYLTTMKYDGKKYTTIKRDKIADVPTNKEFETNTSMILAKLELEKGSNYNLYRTHWSKMGDKETKHKNGIYRKARDKVKTRFNPKSEFEHYKIDLRRLRNRNFEVENGGIEIVCIYKKYKKEKTNINHQEEIEGDITEPSTDGVIQADERGAENYDSEQGIPSSEYQYVNVTSREYLTQYKFRRYYGIKFYKQVIPPEKDKDEKGEPIPPKVKQVSRKFSYWKIVDLNIYQLAYAEIENGTLPNRKLKLFPSNYIPPSVTYLKHSNHLIEPTDDKQHIGEIKVRNDSLKFNGKIIMSDEWCQTKTLPPQKLPIEKTVSSDVLFKNHLQIQPSTANGIYESEGEITYKRICHVGSNAEGNVIKYDVDNINDVIVHTPTICNGKITDVRQHNQMIAPDRSVAGLVLDCNFKVKSPTSGYHSELKGYEERDYQKYISKQEVSFSFDTYRNNNYYAAYSWIPLNTEETEFYLPIWVNEGYHTVKFRNRTINCDKNDGITKEEENANSLVENYVSCSESTVQISGRIYGLSMYDITDYPLWKNVFRRPNSWQFNGFTIPVGNRNQNGSYHFTNLFKPRCTFPTIDGVHPYFKNIGTLKTGYISRFYLTTIGEMYSNMDKVVIKPDFYFINNKGERKEVDVYYTETISGKQKSLVKIGSKLDTSNLKTIHLSDYYRGVPDKELETKAKIEHSSLDLIKSNDAGRYTFSKIQISRQLRTYIGENDSDKRFVPNKFINLLTKSKQKWYFEYYLPSEIYIAPKGTKVYQYGKKHYGIDCNEEFWEKAGNLLISFTIQTLQNNIPHLSYTNVKNAMSGYCNMWKTEGFSYQKTDFKGNKYQFQDGDTLIYSLNQSAAKDYLSSGTH